MSDHETFASPGATADILISRTSERLARVHGVTEEGIEFVDEYVVAVAVVHDAGSISITIPHVPAFIESAKTAGLAVYVEEDDAA